tara:strand:+ start:4412 stop:4681 length:270 start_codon:yes stop_codon:yes gene_type:complete
MNKGSMNGKSRNSGLLLQFKMSKLKMKLRKRTSGTQKLVRTPEGKVMEFSSTEEAYEAAEEFVRTGMWGYPVTLERIYNEVETSQKEVD